MNKDLIYPGGFSGNLLWENKSLNSPFAGQTIRNVAFSGYNWFAIEFLVFNSDIQPIFNKDTQISIAKKGRGTLFGGINAFSFRSYEIADEYIKFSDAGYITPYGGNSTVETNAIMIPVAIYGLN